MLDADAITRHEAAAILAVHVGTVDRMTRHGGLSRGRKFATAQLSRAEVERVALATRPARQLVDGDESYWLTRSGAASVLQRSEVRVGQLVAAGRLPHVEHELSGRRLFRRAQVEVVARARRVRYGNCGAGAGVSVSGVVGSAPS